MISAKSQSEKTDKQSSSDGGREGTWGGRLEAGEKWNEKDDIPIGFTVSASPSRFFGDFLAGARKLPAGGILPERKYDRPPYPAITSFWKMRLNICQKVSFSTAVSATIGISFNTCSPALIYNVPSRCPLLTGASICSSSTTCWVT